MQYLPFDCEFICAWRVEQVTLFAQCWEELLPDSPAYSQDCIIFLTQLNNWKKLKKKLGCFATLCKFPCHKVLHYRESHSLFLNFSHIKYVISWPQLKNWRISQLLMTFYKHILGEAWFLVLGVLLGTFVGFCPPFLYLGDECGTWSTCSFQMTCICHFFSLFFLALPRASYGYIQCDLILNAVWRFSNKFSISLRCRKFSFK